MSDDADGTEFATRPRTSHSLTCVEFLVEVDGISLSPRCLIKTRMDSSLTGKCLIIGILQSPVTPTYPWATSLSLQPSAKNLVNGGKDTILPFCCCVADDCYLGHPCQLFGTSLPNQMLRYSRGDSSYVAAQLGHCGLREHLPHSTDSLPMSLRLPLPLGCS